MKNELKFGSQNALNDSLLTFILSLMLPIMDPLTLYSHEYSKCCFEKEKHVLNVHFSLCTHLL